MGNKINKSDSIYNTSVVKCCQCCVDPLSHTSRPSDDTLAVSEELVMTLLVISDDWMMTHLSLVKTW